MRFRFENRHLPEGRTPITIICEISELPICEVCNKNLNNNNYAWYCQNNKFYHENCFFLNDFNLQHDKNTDKGIHSDKLILIKLIPNL